MFPTPYIEKTVVERYWNSEFHVCLDVDTIRTDTSLCHNNHKSVFRFPLSSPFFYFLYSPEQYNPFPLQISQRLPLAIPYSMLLSISTNCSEFRKEYLALSWIRLRCFVSRLTFRIHVDPYLDLAYSNGTLTNANILTCRADCPLYLRYQIHCQPRLGELLYLVWLAALVASFSVCSAICGCVIAWNRSSY